MGEYFTMLADADVALDAAPGVSATIIRELQHLGIISTESNGDCVLSGIGYLPGPKLADIYDAEPDGYRFWEMAACGVEPKVGRSFNYFAYGPACTGLTCPKCSAFFDASLAAFGDTIWDAIKEWFNTGSAMLACPECQHKTPLPDWPAENPLAFGNLSFTFWNWPPFDQPEWLLDIPALLRDITGHRIISSYGKV